jgi:hypothetical protein
VPAGRAAEVGSGPRSQLIGVAPQSALPCSVCSPLRPAAPAPPPSPAAMGPIVRLTMPRMVKDRPGGRSDLTILEVQGRSFRVGQVPREIGFDLSTRV